MCSGPARIARGKEELLKKYEQEFKADRVVGILEASSVPPPNAIAEFANECQLTPENVMLCIAKTSSLPGTIQVVARSIETTMHKLFELGFDLNQIRSAVGWSPIPPLAKDDLTSLGWTNDSILYGTETQLWVETDDEVIESLGPRIPSSTSPDFGTPFGEIFKRYEFDFYKIDKMLFSPARVTVNNLRTGRSFVFGEFRWDIFHASIGIA